MDSFREPGRRHRRRCDVCGGQYHGGGLCEFAPACPRSLRRRRDLCVAEARACWDGLHHVIAFYGIAVRYWCPGPQPSPPAPRTRPPRDPRILTWGLRLRPAPAPPVPTSSCLPPASHDALAPSPAQAATAAQDTMGARYTAPADRGAGRQAGWRPLSLFEAEDALSERLVRLLQMWTGCGRRCTSTMERTLL